MIQDAATYMNTLIGAMLTRSKTGWVDLHPQAVEWPTGGLINLLGNTVKDGQGRHPLHVRVWAEERATEWAICVQDTGVGFDPTCAHKLFVAFQQLHNPRDFAGTGTGLATVKRVVPQHHGRV